MKALGRHLTGLTALLFFAQCSTLVRSPDLPVAYEKAEPGTAWRDVVSTYVDEVGRVDFKRLSNTPEKLHVYVNYISRISPRSHPEHFKTKDAALAYYLNSYNALSLYNILDAGIPESLGGLKKIKFFYFKKFVVGGEEMSLYAYENDIIRKQEDERVHFALNCMSRGCPRLPRYPFPEDGLGTELDKQAKFFFGEERNLKIDPEKKRIYVSEILSFFTEDFLRKDPTLIQYINRYRREKIPDEYRVEFIPYDWTVNSQPVAVGE